jgi:hypothetical protein
MASASAAQGLGGITSGRFETLRKILPHGSLQARKRASGEISFYWRYTIRGATERVPIGRYDSSAPPKGLAPTVQGYSLAAATRAAERLALEHDQHLDAGGRPALIEARRAADAAAAEATEKAAAHTFQGLLNAYCDYLKSIGRRSHSDARGIFKLHILEAWPEVAALPANQVSSEAFADMMRKLIDAGKGRTANKLRSYARAAYQVARSAKSKPSVPVAFKAFGILSNPVADTEPDESQNRPDKNPLSASDLKAYWRLIKDLPGFKGALLRLHLLTGAQRIEQLVNLCTTAVAQDSILLLDGKGRPGRPPRPHLVPLIRPAVQALAECKPVGKFALSTDGGETHVAATTLSVWATAVADGTIEAFQAKRLRSGIETLLAGAGVSMEIRGRLQSHGISGVQARHYDGHDYLREKRKALELMYKLLETSNVQKNRRNRNDAAGPSRPPG